MPALPQKIKSPLSPSTSTSASPSSSPLILATTMAAVPPLASTTPRLSKTKIKASSLDYDIFLKHHNPTKSSSLASTTTLAASAAAAAKKLKNNNNIGVAVGANHHQHQQHLTSEWKLHNQTSLPPLTTKTKFSPSTTTNQIGRAASTASLASSTITTGGNYQEFKMEIINQGKCLCGQYIRARLRRAGYLNRKAIQRLRSILEPSSEIVFEVFPALNSMGEELERMHPRVYTNISRQLSRAPFGELEDSDTAPMLLNLVAKDLFRSSITWGKIISIFAVCGGFAIDCVRQGHYDYLQFLVDGIAEIIEDDLVHWLVDNGGWLGLQQHIRPQNGKITFLGWLALFVVMSSSFYVVMKFLKHVGCHLYTFLLRKG